MIIYTVINIKTYKTHYVAELLNKAEVDIYNRGKLKTLLAGTNINPELVKTVVVNKFEPNGYPIEEIVKHSKSYVIDTPEEFVVNAINCPLKIKKDPTEIKTVQTPSVDTRTTENVRDDLEEQYREFILLLHRSEMEIASIRRKVSAAFDKFQDAKILAKFHSNTNNGIDK